MKKVLCVLISVILVLSCSSVAFAGGNKAELYTFYGDGMLFQQNKEAILSGTAENGSLISASLYKNDVLVAQNSAKAENGEFSVSFDAPEGSYDRYSVSLRCNNTELAVLGDVVFGELWLASGQSNMQYSFAQEKTGASMFANGEKFGDWLRVLLVPPVTQYNGSYERVPATPQNDIPEAKWVNGNSSAVYEMLKSFTKSLMFPLVCSMLRSAVHVSQAGFQEMPSTAIPKLKISSLHAENIIPLIAGMRPNAVCFMT